MNSSYGKTARIGFWTVLCLSVIAWAPTTYPGYWRALEGYVPLFNATTIQAVADVATTPDVWRGMGSATFMLVQPLLLLGMGLEAAVRTVFAFALIAGGLGIYIWLQSALGDRAAGLAGVLYMLAPPFLATIYIRGSLSDALIMGLLPLVLAGLRVFRVRRTPAAAGAAVFSLLWIWRVQAGLAIFVTLLLLLYVLLIERDRLSTLIVLTGGVAGLVSLIPLWAIQGPPPAPFYDHFVYFFQLFGHGWQIAPSIAGWQDGYPFQLGFAAVAFSLAALWLRYAAQDEPLADFASRLWLFCVITSVVLVLLCLNISQPLWRVTSADRLLRYPWQMLLLATPWLTAVAASLPRLNRALHSTPYWTVLLTLAVLSSYPYLTTNFTQLDAPAKPVAAIGLPYQDASQQQPDQRDQFVVLAATVSSGVTTTAQLDLTWQTLQPLDFDYNVFFQALAGEDAQPTVVAQLDTQPLQGLQPATSWQPGAIFTDTYQLDLSGVAPEVRSDLHYIFGYYDWRNGQRLQVTDAAGITDDKLVLYGQ
ncbi:MAG: hypothetical protein R3A44_21405 [Caldilineaceae bacterium]